MSRQPPRAVGRLGQRFDVYDVPRQVWNSKKERSSTRRLRESRVGWNKLLVTRVNYQHRKHSSQNRNKRIWREDASPPGACGWLTGARLRPHVLHQPVALFGNGLNVASAFAVIS